MVLPGERLADPKYMSDIRYMGNVRVIRNNYEHGVKTTDVFEVGTVGVKVANLRSESDN